MCSFHFSLQCFFFFSKKFLAPINIGEPRSRHEQKSARVSRSVSNYPILIKSCNVPVVFFSETPQYCTSLLSFQSLSSSQIQSDRQRVVTKLICTFVTFIGHAQILTCSAHYCALQSLFYKQLWENL
jgi:hypothetical protein